MPERSFFYKGKQFPVCARCTGVFIGRLAAFATFWWVKVDLWIPIAFLAAMFLDWGLQYLKIKESTNIRRLITGLLGGYGLVYIVLWLIFWLISRFA
ncbi:MAG: DUF2085 domain-containing protein [Oscillospiraceae bacterium]|nr:DUF2085 domain-containing protein [Oscillospiraceae bacterium]